MNRPEDQRGAVWLLVDALAEMTSSAIGLFEFWYEVTGSLIINILENFWVDTMNMMVGICITGYKSSH
jgi:hypothetical protein